MFKVTARSEETAFPLGALIQSPDLHSSAHYTKIVLKKMAREFRDEKMFEEEGGLCQETRQFQDQSVICPRFILQSLKNGNKEERVCHFMKFLSDQQRSTDIECMLGTVSLCEFGLSQFPINGHQPEYFPLIGKTLDLSENPNLNNKTFDPNGLNWLTFLELNLYKTNVDIKASGLLSWIKENLIIPMDIIDKDGNRIHFYVFESGDNRTVSLAVDTNFSEQLELPSIESTRAIINFQIESTSKERGSKTLLNVLKLARDKQLKENQDQLGAPMDTRPDTDDQIVPLNPRNRKISGTQMAEAWATGSWD